MIRREKRFFVHAEMDGKEVIAHTNNTGSMLGLLNPGSPVLLSSAPRPDRKLKWTLEAVGMRERGRLFWAGVNTSVPNKLLSALFARGYLRWAKGYDHLRREAPCGESRLDGCLSGAGLPLLWLECKNVTLVEDGEAAFPDAVTARGTKHLRTLQRLCKQGMRAAMLYVIQRPDGRCFRAAEYIDETYALALRQAAESGVEIYPIVVEVQKDGIRCKGEIPYVL